MDLIYLSLHTKDGEADYEGYHRIATSSFIEKDDMVMLTDRLSFPECTAGRNTVTHVGFHETMDGVSLGIDDILPHIETTPGSWPQLVPGTMIRKE